MLGADVVVAERERLAQRELEHLLRARRERDLARRDLVALADDARHLGAHLLDGDVEALEHARGEPFLLAQQAEQDVLGADVVVLEGAGLVLGEDDDLSGRSVKRSNNAYVLSSTAVPMVADASGVVLSERVPGVSVSETPFMSLEAL